MPVLAPSARSGDIHTRLRRAEGQVLGIRRMYEAGRPCADVLEQLAAARAALESIALLVLRDHVEDCLEPIAHDDDAEARADQLLLAVKRFVRSVR